MNKTKKSALILIAAVILRVFASCATTQAPDNTGGIDLPEPELTEFSNEPAAEPMPEGYYFAYKDFNILLDADYEKVSAEIGEANDVFEAPSCAFDGLDKMFYYDDFIIGTYPDGEKDFIMSITLTSDNVQTPEGAKLGMGFGDIIKIYGGAYENNFDLYFYTQGDIELSFFFENDVLVEINYYFLPATNQ